MIASPNDVAVFSRAGYDRLPDGRWEVASGRAILLGAPSFWHQELSDELLVSLRSQVRIAGRGFVTSGVSVFIPVPRGVSSEIQSRIPDLSISVQRPATGLYEAGNAPEWVIEILSTRRGNIERTEKLDDYAHAGVREYWIVNPIDRDAEVYSLAAGDYVLVEKSSYPKSQTFPGVAIDMVPLWPEIN